MAYTGSTALSSVANPPILMFRPMASGNQSTQGPNLLMSTASTSFGAVSGGNGIWYYQSTDPTSTIINTLSYFTDGLQLGMKNGDIIFTVSVTSAGSTASLLFGGGVLVTTNSTAGFTIGAGSVLLATQ